MCIFSKHVILETFQHIFALNGYAHKVHHGDWFGGKGVGLAKIMCHGIRLNVYVTHVSFIFVKTKDICVIHILNIQKLSGRSIA